MTDSDSRGQHQASRQQGRAQLCRFKEAGWTVDASGAWTWGQSRPGSMCPGHKTEVGGRWTGCRRLPESRNQTLIRAILFRRNLSSLHGGTQAEMGPCRPRASCPASFPAPQETRPSSDTQSRGSQSWGSPHQPPTPSTNTPGPGSVQ